MDAIKILNKLAELWLDQQNIRGSVVIEKTNNNDADDSVSNDKAS